MSAEITDEELEALMNEVAEEEEGPIVVVKKTPPKKKVEKKPVTEEVPTAVVEKLQGEVGEVLVTTGDIKSDTLTTGAVTMGELSVAAMDEMSGATMVSDEKAEITVNAEEVESKVIEEDIEKPKSTVSGLKSFIDVEKLKADVKINPINIDVELAEHASKFVHYAVQSSEARRQHERMKAAFDILESRLYHEHRTVLKTDNPKVTEAQIKSAVICDKRWLGGNSRMIDARAIYDLAQSAKEAFGMRRDTMLQMAKDMREERLGAMRIKEIQAGAGHGGRASSQLG
jgi:hypothetical protein